MDVRVLNKEKWEKTFTTGKAIIRVGSGLSCDVCISDPDLPPQIMQLFTDPKDPTRSSVTAIALGVTIQRESEIVACQPMKPCPLAQYGDTICFGKYKLQIIPPLENKITKKTPNISAVLHFSSNQLSPDSPITGTVELSNLDPHKACQFTMTVTGLPESCIEIGPMPFIPAGGKSSIGFILKHLRTEPEPGFQTAIITISEPEAHFGETISFWLLIHSEPYIKTNFVLEDDTDQFLIKRKKAVSPEKPEKDLQTETKPERKETANDSGTIFSADHPKEEPVGNTAAPEPQKPAPRVSDTENFVIRNENTSDPFEKEEVKESFKPEEPQSTPAKFISEASEDKKESGTEFAPPITKPDPFESESASASASAPEETALPAPESVTDQKAPVPEEETVSLPDDAEAITGAEGLTDEVSEKEADNEWEIPVFSQKSTFFDEEPSAEETIVEEPVEENVPKVISIKGDNDGFI